MRTHHSLQIVAGLGMVVALWTGLFPVVPPDVAFRPNQLSVELSTTITSMAELRFDREAGWNDPLKARQRIDANKPLTEFRFGLPAGRVVRLRFDLGSGNAVIHLRRAVVMTTEGRVVHEFEPADFLPEHPRQQLTWQEGELTVTPESGANPIVLLQPRRPLQLPNESPEGRAIAAPIVRMERGIAAGLFLLGLGLLLAQQRSKRQAGDTVVPAWQREAIVLAYAAMCLLFSRRPDFFANPQFWMEDARVFFVQQATHGWSALLLTHGGYIHLWPRLVAWFATHFPVVWAPLIYHAGALVVIVVAVVRAGSARVGLPGAYACALAVVLVPNSDEVMFNLTNAQWFGAVVLLLVVLAPAPVNRWQFAGDLLAVVVLGLSGPFAVFLCPLFIARAVLARTGRQAVWLTAAVAVAIAATQYWFYRHSPDAAGFGLKMDVAEAVAAIGYRTGGQLLNVLPSSAHGDVMVAGWSGALFWVALWVALPVGHAFRRHRALMAFAAAVVLLGGLLRYRELLWVFFIEVHVQRYFLLPLLVSLWLLIAGCAQTGVRRWIAVALLLIIAVRNTGFYRIHANMDLHWPEYAAKIEQGEAVDIPINPRPWTAAYPAAKE